MAEISYTEFEDKEVKKFIKDMDKRLKEIEGGKKKFQGILSVIVYRDVIEHFQDEKGSEGDWAEWSPSYQAAIDGAVFFRKIAGRTVPFDPEKTKKPPKPPRKPGKILQDKGRLRNSFKPTNVRKHSAGLLWFNNAQTKGGFPYAAAHDEGGAQLPKRDFMWLSQKAVDDMAKQTLLFLLEEKGEK